MEKKAKLIVAACDVSEKSRKEAAFFANKAGIGLITFNEYNMTAVSDAVGPQVRNTFGKRQRFCRRSFKGVR